MDVRRFRSGRMLLPKIPGPLANPTASSLGAPLGWPFFWLLFLGHTKKSDSPVARLSTAKLVNALLQGKSGERSPPPTTASEGRLCAGMTSKNTPPRSPPALRARGEARSKIKMGPGLRWDDDLKDDDHGMAAQKQTARVSGLFDVKPLSRESLSRRPWTGRRRPPLPPRPIPGLRARRARARPSRPC